MKSLSKWGRKKDPVLPVRRYDVNGEERHTTDAEFSWHWREVLHRLWLLIIPLVAVTEEHFHISRNASYTEGEIHCSRQWWPWENEPVLSDLPWTGIICAVTLPRVLQMACISLLTLWETLPVLMTASQGTIICILFYFSICFHLAHFPTSHRWCNTGSQQYKKTPLQPNISPKKQSS